jgi:hypothetical protein
MSDLPAPLVPAEVDLRDFQYMELDVRRLRDSRFGAEVSGDAFRAGVMLWCAAWHQVPAGSLPDDDIELANLAGYGRFVKEWRKVRAEALQGFVPCSDGRLYHEVVCEKALQAWNSKLQHQYDRARDRLRKLNKQRANEKLDPIPEITFEQWNARRMASGIPMEKADASAGIPEKPPAAIGGIPAENALRGNGEGTERERNGEGDFKDSVPGGTVGAAAPDPDPAPAPPAAPAPPPRKRASPPPPKTLDVAALVAEGVDPQHAADWLAVRKAKDLLLTPTAWEKAKAEAQKAGMSVADAVREAAANSWGGFRASWLQRQDVPRANGATHAPVDTAARDAEAKRLLFGASAPPTTPEVIADA